MQDNPTTTDVTTATLIVVEQVDREAVQAFHSAMLDKLMTAAKDKKAGARFGEDEGDAGTLVQAFARHRILAEEIARASAMMLGSPPPVTASTVEFVRYWMMSSDEPETSWERDFACAIDARAAAIREKTDA